jgi:hypothetical protein
MAEICFSISLFFYIVLNEYLSSFIPPNENLTRLILSFLSSIGFYFLVYSAFYELYDRFIYPIVNPIFNIAGKWYHIGVLENGDIRHGTVNITFRKRDLVMLGDNRKIDGAFSSSWRTETIKMEDREIILIYNSEGKNRAHPQSKGEMVLHIHGSPPDKITGLWNDMAPHQNRGEITLYKKYDEYKKIIENIQKGLEGK